MSMKAHCQVSCTTRRLGDEEKKKDSSYDIDSPFVVLLMKSSLYEQSANPDRTHDS